MTEQARSWICCPGCGSCLTGPTRDPAWWECRYHRCGLVFPVGPDSRQRKLTDERDSIPVLRRGEPRDAPGG